MARPYFVVEGTSGSAVELWPDPTRPGELLLTANAGTKVRVRLDEEKSIRLGAALNRWYGNGPEETITQDTVANDTILEFRDGQVYSFTSPPEV